MLKKSDKPMYLKLYEKILNNIENKKYNNYDKLPSENEFAKEFCVNRHTIRQALELLKSEGFIYTILGKGTYISNIKVPYSISDKSSYSSKILDLGYEPKTTLLGVDIIEASEDVAKNLGINTKLKVIEFRLLRFANDLPISISYSYFDAYLYRELINNLDCKPFSLYKILEKSYPNLEVTKISTIFESVMATKEQSTLLMMPSNSPLLAACTISKDQNGNFVEYGTSYFRGDICKIKVDLI
ncbi:GntR family transcriptional regulator [bacterium]|nr:GntR family transcriptional regulator [bacterium]